MNTSVETKTSSPLAFFGGPKAIQSDPKDLHNWPIITEEDEKAVLESLRAGNMSDWDITVEFEKEFAAWQGTKHALTYTNGTAAILATLFGFNLSAGDEVIVPSMTYWASALPALSLGLVPVLADIEADSLCLDPDSFETHITEHTKAVVVVHTMGHPADMDRIMAIANKHDLKVLEDVSHAQGGLYKGKKLGTMGHAGAASLMSGKSLVAGEAGVLWTNDQEIYDRAVAWGHYNRFTPDITTENLRHLAGLPIGGVKGRLVQLASALGRTQLRHYDERCEEIRKSTNYFWDLLEGVPGLRAHRIQTENSNMAGWYAAHGHYRTEELEGLSLTRFAEAVKAEGGYIIPGCNLPLHLHPLLTETDIYGHGSPTRQFFARRDVTQPKGSLPVSETIGAKVYNIPRLIRFYPELIEEQAAAYRKVAVNYKELLADDPGDPETLGAWSQTFAK